MSSPTYTPGGNALVPIEATTSGPTLLVAASSNAAAHVAVARYFLTTSTAVNIKFQSSPDGSTFTDITGSLTLVAAGNGLTDTVDNPARDVLFATAAGAGLYITLSGAATVGGYLAWRYDPQFTGYPSQGGNWVNYPQ